MQLYVTNFRSENYFLVIQQWTLAVIIEQFYTEIMTENYNNGNIKIWDKSSTHLRHKFFYSVNVKFRIFPREKPTLPVDTNSPKQRTKLVLTNSENQQTNLGKLPWKIPLPTNLLQPPVRPVDVSGTIVDINGTTVDVNGTDC